MANLQGAPAVTEKLILYIEQHYAESGSSYESGKRVVVIPESISKIAARFGVSTGTIKNCLVYLEKVGYILSRDSGMYLCLAPEFLTPENEGLEDMDEDDLIPGLSHERRLDEDTVRAIVRELIRDRGQRDAMMYLRAHRLWCWMNNLTPYL